MTLHHIIHIDIRLDKLALPENLTLALFSPFRMNCEKMLRINPNLNFANINVCTQFCQTMSISSHDIVNDQKRNSDIYHGCNSVTNLRKMRVNHPNLYLLNLNVYTKFGLILSIRSQDIKGRNSDTKLRKMTVNNPTQLDLVNINVYTNFGQILSIRSQDSERK